MSTTGTPAKVMNECRLPLHKITKSISTSDDYFQLHIKKYNIVACFIHSTAFTTSSYFKSGKLIYFAVAYTLREPDQPSHKKIKQNELDTHSET